MAFLTAGAQHSRKKKPKGDLLKVVQCESEKIGYLNASQSWHLSPLRKVFLDVIGFNPKK